MNYISRFAEFATPEKGAKFGIEKISEFVAYLGEFIPQVVDAAADGKIGLFEALGLTSPIIKGGRLLLNLRQMGEELRDLDNAEKDQLIKQLKETPAFRTKNSAEVIDFLDIAADVVLDIWALFQRGRRLYNIIKS